MGAFTRFGEIISSNINAMLDKAEDPEKLIGFMIREMEDTLVEIRTACAGVIAGRKKVERQLKEIREHENEWAEKAKLAVSRSRDDLAREALKEKRAYAQKADMLEKEAAEHKELVLQYEEDIRQLDEKLGTAKEKQRILAHRHTHAVRKIQARKKIGRMDSSKAILRFDKLENRIERMEAEAEMIGFGSKSRLGEEFENLAIDDEIEKELQSLKSKDEK